MNIMQKIIQHKQQEVAHRRERFPVPLLEDSIYFDTPCISLKKYLLRPDKSGIVAEFKRASPSEGAINPYASVERVTIGYMQAGASALSVLTDTAFFKGKLKDLTEARDFNFCPILRKDFVIDEYQLIEARSIGADAVLLIAECLERTQLKALARQAKSLGMEVLMECHSRAQLEKANEYVDVVGVNNRNLEDFSVSIETSMELASAIPQAFVKISESGISDPHAIVQLRQYGYQGFLIGAYFMRADEPHKRCQEFIRRIEAVENAHGNPIA
jgi:indole-3-glycerol phosphate synthase